ncbi:MAG: FAD-dependent oxidoreductase, partial [bacterium]|nr:FAD-dependent oxidoreductase [bacterium]
QLRATTKMTKHVNTLQWTAKGYELPVFAAVIPAAVAAAGVEKVKVAIVGGGLTGLTLAADLATRGIDAVLLDDDNSVGVRGASSRGMVWAQKTIEIMDRLGIAQRIIDKGVIWSVGKTLSGAEVVYSFNRAEDNASLQPSFVNLQQFYVEWYLVERIRELGRVELRWNNTVTALHPSESSVRLDVETPGGRYAIEADWVIDATGANSPLRAEMGLDVDVARHVDQWCICDARCVGLDVPERWTWVDAPFNGGRAVWQHMMADSIWRFDYQLEPEGDPAESARLEVAAERVRAHLGPDVDFELVWVGPWAYRTQILDRFRAGRVLFAGDAAHVMSPFGARGGNSGIQDADNLGWKLALVLEGKAGPALLDSYDGERRAAAVENISITSRSARFLAPQSPFERRMRDVVLELSREHAFARTIVNTGRLSMPNRYPASTMIGAGGGFCLPNSRLVDGSGASTSLSEVMRSLGSAALGLYLPRQGVDPSRAAISGIGGEGLPYFVRTLGTGQGAERCGLIDVSGHLAALTGARAGDLIIVRPDLYCAGVVRNATAAAAEAALATSVAFGSSAHAP